MKKLLSLALALVMPLTLAACGNNNNATTNNSNRQGEQSATKESAAQTVRLPENYDKGVLYTTVTRGNTKELLYANRETIEAVKAGKPFPSGTAFTLEIYRDGVLSDIFVAEKRTGWGDQNSPKKSNGDWRYQAFTADKSVNTKRDIESCISCHASQVRDDFVYTSNQMKSFELEDTASQDNSTESRLAAIPLEDWKINTLKEYLANLTSEES